MGAALLVRFRSPSSYSPRPVREVIQRTILREYAWYAETTRSARTWPVGQLKPNDLGLFDVYGNVWEWCQDRGVPNRPAPSGGVSEDAEEPPSPVSAVHSRVVRGGAFGNLAVGLRSAARDLERPMSRPDAYVGFRVARTCR
jgi:formylglycine-generating enzyme required for sulfatase activity